MPGNDEARPSKRRIRFSALTINTMFRLFLSGMLETAIPYRVAQVSMNAVVTATLVWREAPDQNMRQAAGLESSRRARQLGTVVKSVRWRLFTIDQNKATHLHCTDALDNSPAF